MFELALNEKGVPFESHIYSCGGHGFSTAESWIRIDSGSTRLPNWLEESIGWLKEVLGEFTKQGMQQPNIDICINGDAAPVLSVSCSMKHLYRQTEEIQELLKPIYDGIAIVAAARGIDKEKAMKLIEMNTLRDIMEMLQMDEATIADLDATFHGIVNQTE